MVKQISDNEIYLLIKYIKSVLWRVAKRLSYIQDARCLKVKKVQFSYDKLSKTQVSEQLYCTEGVPWQLAVAVSYTAADNSQSHEHVEVAKCRHRATAFVCKILHAMIVSTAIIWQSFGNLWVWKSVQQAFWRYQVKYEQLPQSPLSEEVITTKTNRKKHKSI